MAKLRQAQTPSPERKDAVPGGGLPLRELLAIVRRRRKAHLARSGTDHRRGSTLNEILHSRTPHPPGSSRCSSVEVSPQCVPAVGDRVLTENQPFFPSMPDLRVPPSDQALGCKRSLS